MGKNRRIIEVVSHNPFWAQQYQDEVKNITSVLRGIIVASHHIGSTAIPNICAKPVIDILVEVSDIEAVDLFEEPMKALLYVPKGEYGIKGRRFFLKGEINRTHHIHVFQSGDSQITRHICFRDYMIAHPVDAQHYAALKMKLAEQFRFDNEAYCDGKDAFIKEIDAKAAAWKNWKR